MPSTEDILATVSAMRCKEETDYQCEDYISRFIQSYSVESCCVDEECRRLMADWTFKVVDRCLFSRETASIAMNILDRFLATEAGVSALKNRHLFQLASMTSMYTAIKVHESEALQPETIMQLSRGLFTVQDIEKMEATILFATNWRVNPPTPLIFIQHFLDTLPSEILHETERNVIMELAKLHAELSITTYKYVSIKPSSVAFAALANSVELLNLDSIKSSLEILVSLMAIDEQQVCIIREDLLQQVQDKFPEAVPVTRLVHSMFDEDYNVASSKNLQSTTGELSPRGVHSVNQ